MNIKFTDENLFKLLKESALVVVPVGSRSYGLEHAHSDHDWLYIYPTPKNELNSPFRGHHQFQYKDKEGNDHLFVSLHSFITNLVSGDSILNFEALHTPEFATSILGVFSKRKRIFYSLTIIRAYLGRARKDFKNYDKLVKLHNSVRSKKLLHMMRSFDFAKAVHEGALQLNGGPARVQWDKIMALPGAEQEKYARNYYLNIDFFREKLVNEKQYIPVFMGVNEQLLVDALITEIRHTKEYRQKRKNLGLQLSMQPFYHANELGITYDTIQNG